MALQGRGAPQVIAARAQASSSAACSGTEAHCQVQLIYQPDCLTGWAAHVAPSLDGLAGAAAGSLGAAHLAGAHVAQVCSKSSRWKWIYRELVTHDENMQQLETRTQGLLPTARSRPSLLANAPSLSGQHFLLTKSYLSAGKDKWLGVQGELMSERQHLFAQLTQQC